MKGPWGQGRVLPGLGAGGVWPRAGSCSGLRGRFLSRAGTAARMCLRPSGPVATQMSASVSDGLPCGFLLFLLSLKFVSNPSHDQVSPSSPVLCCCCDTELAAGELQRCWIPSESGALKAQLHLAQVTLQQAGPSEGDFSFLTEGSVKGGECLGGFQLKDKRHSGQGNTELGLSCSH